MLRFSSCIVNFLPKILGVLLQYLYCQCDGHQYRKQEYRHCCHAKDTIQRLAVVDGAEKMMCPQVQWNENDGN